MRRRRRRADERRLERSAVGSAAVLLWFLGVFERLHGRMHATQAGGDLRSHRTPPLRLALPPGDALLSMAKKEPRCAARSLGDARGEASRYGARQSFAPIIQTLA